jgi:hypothetical protein
MMVMLRRHAAWVVGAWLLCQTSAMVLVPVTLCMTDRSGAVQQACTCDHADGQECPMHHTRSLPRSSSRSSCSCRSTTDGPTATLASLIGPIAVLTSRATAVANVTNTQLPTNPDAALFGASRALDPPPPRA